jgi:GTPase-associated protein 1, N-terminal domain type 1
MTQDAQKIKLGQALHGYQDGHSLLASSETLPHVAESTLFHLSDLSGPQLVGGFEEYLSGYPVPEIASYAFAKTWYAPEMQRPGCVWTHTLLIRSSDIGRIEDLLQLRRYFKRPTTDSNSWNKYNEYLEIPTSTPSRDEDTNAVPFLLTLYRALYEAQDIPVVLPATNTKKFESLILRIWNQQWPRLRRAFKFCTGAIEGRILEGKSFDLQVIPFESISRVQREISDVFIVQDETTAEKANIERWVSQLVEDFSFPNGRFHDFLREFGTDVAPRRSSFKKLVEAYNLHSSDTDFAEYWEGLLTLFPSQNEAAKLKMSAIVPNYSDAKAINIPLPDRLSVLVASHHDSSYPKRLLESTDLKESLLSGESLRDLLQALSSAPYINSFGETLIQNIATNVGPKQLATIASTPSAVMLLLTRNPRLARFQELWSVTNGRQQQLLDLISGSHLTQPDWEEIMYAAIQARVPQIARSFVRIMGVSAVHAALNICQQYSAILPEDWNSLLGEQTPTVAEWLRSHPDAGSSLLRKLAQNLSPFDSALLSLGSDIWQPVLDDDMKPPQRVCAFILSLGLQNPSGKPFELVSRTFEVIHQAAELERLESATWMILRDSLPALGWGRDWDVCERLRQLLVSKYVSYSWPISYLFRTLQDRVTFERTLLYILSEKHLRPFGRFLLSEARSGSASPSAMQNELLSKYEKKLRK